LARLLAAARDGRLTIKAIRAAVSALRPRAEPTQPLPPPCTATRGTSLRLLGRLAESLTAEHAAARPLRAKERDQLLRLKDAITRRLEAPAR
jgi:hypothetical protein